MSKYLIMDSEGNIYKSVAQAERETGIAHQNISSVLNGKRGSAGGLAWARVDLDEGNATFEDKQDELIEQIKQKEEGLTPKQQKAKNKSWKMRKHYQQTVENAKSLGLLYYHFPKELGDNPTNKQIHLYNMKENENYKQYYNELQNSESQEIYLDF